MGASGRPTATVMPIGARPGLALPVLATAAAGLSGGGGRAGPSLTSARCQPHAGLLILALQRLGVGVHPLRAAGARGARPPCHVQWGLVLQSHVPAERESVPEGSG